MERIRKAALLTRLIEELRNKGSWCGETHVQKSTLFLQELMGVPLGFDFILYKHGPFSFDLREELTSLRADQLIRLEPQWPYGPRIAPTERSEYIQNISSRTLSKYRADIECVADKLGAKGVADLERLTTAFFLTQQAKGETSMDERAKELRKLKPHISLEAAQAAVVEIDQMIEEVGREAGATS